MAPSSNSFTITGLTNGNFYKIKIRAVNALGDGEESQEIGPFKPNTIPGTISAPSVSRGTGSSTTDTFSWSAPDSGGSTITKYGYQLSTDAGNSWSNEIETTSTSLAYAAGYTSTNIYLKVRAYNNGSNGGWGSYSVLSSGSSGGWASVEGTETENQSDTVCGPDGCSQSQSDSSCNDCLETIPQNCDCGTQTKTRTRTRSRSRTRTRSSSRTRSRSRSTQYWSRSGNTNSSITYGSWSISDYEWGLAASSGVGWSTYSYDSWSISDYEWNLGVSSGVGWGSFTYTQYPDWSTIAWSPCTGGIWSTVPQAFVDECIYAAIGEGGAPAGYYTDSIWGWWRASGAGCTAYANMCTDLYAQGFDGAQNLYSCNQTGNKKASGYICIVPSW